MISVIIPTFKFQDYIWDCLRSLENQTLSPENFEVVIILNGCNEPYSSLLQDYKCKQDINGRRIKVCQTDISGVSNARNIGLSLVNGEYVVFLDDDDILSPDYLKSLYQHARKDAIIVSNVFSFYTSIDERNQDYLTFSEKDRKGLFFNRRYLSNACCKLIPLEMMREKQFNVNFKNGEDALFMFSISNCIKQIIKTDYECIYYRRLRINSASRKKMGLARKIKNILRQQMAYSRIYFSGIHKYSLLLYLSRLLAVFKQ